MADCQILYYYPSSAGRPERSIAMTIDDLQEWV